MGFLDMFASETTCPDCGTKPARKVLWMLRCPNRQCARFDAGWRDALAMSGRHPRTPEAAAAEPAAPEPTVPAPRVPEVVTAVSASDQGEHRLEIAYTNHTGQKKVFVGDARTIRRRGRHVSLRVEPSNTRIALALHRIDNVETVEQALADYPEPKPVERQILGYYQYNEGTSNRLREVQAKYPHWEAYVAGR